MLLRDQVTSTEENQFAQAHQISGEMLAKNFPLYFVACNNCSMTTFGEISSGILGRECAEYILGLWREFRNRYEREVCGSRNGPRASLVFVVQPSTFVVCIGWFLRWSRNCGEHQAC